METPEPYFFDWVRVHSASDPSSLRLKYGSKKNDGIDYSAAIDQIECRRKFAGKLSETLAAFPDFFFPSVLAGEQASSDLLADYHASLITAGARVADLTAGLGIDVFHLARKASEVVAVELDNERAEALRFNSVGLRCGNVEIVEGDCRDFVRAAVAARRFFDVVFIDPARRDNDGRRVFALADCRPDVVEMLPDIAKICRKLIIKASPMLDITHSADAVGTCLETAVALGTPTDCKELLLVADFEKSSEEAAIRAVVLSKEGSLTYSFFRSRENAAQMPAPGRVLMTGDYLYEAYPEVMKTGVFKLLASEFGLNIINPNTKLLYSGELNTSFPGRVYKVLEVFPYASKVIKRFKKDYPKVCVAVRNFGMSADALRARLGVADGGPLRLYGFTDATGDKVLALTEEVNSDKNLSV